MGFTVHRQGIDLNPTKAKAIRDMEPPKSTKQLKSLRESLLHKKVHSSLGRASQTVPAITEEGCYIPMEGRPASCLLRVKDVLSSSHTMVSPTKGLPLTLYLTSTNKSIGVLLAQEVEGTEKPVYYLNRSLQGAELNYSPIERHCFAHIFAMQKLRHYFLAHSLHMVTKSNPLRYLISRLVLSGRIARWLLQLSEFDIAVVNPKGSGAKP